MSPFVTLYLGCPIIVEARVLFPEPFGPMMACISPCLTWKSTPFSISLPSMEACRSLISSWLNSVSFLLSLLRFCSRLISFLRLDKSGMTYVIFKGTKTSRDSRVSQFPAEPRDDRPYLTDSNNFSIIVGNRTRVGFTGPHHFPQGFGVRRSMTVNVTS